MKENYLWDKTGADPGVEKLENALRVFSHRSGPPPVLPVATVSDKRPFLSRFAPLAFAMAALAVAAVAWGVWIQFPGDVDHRDTRADVTAPQVDTPPANIPGNPVPVYIDKQVAPKVRQPGQIAKADPGARPKTPRAERAVLRVFVPENRPKFTKEEIYAYDQLRLALSITSDRLGQVREMAIGEQTKYQEK